MTIWEAFSAEFPDGVCAGRAVHYEYLFASAGHTTFHRFRPGRRRYMAGNCCGMVLVDGQDVACDRGNQVPLAFGDHESAFDTPQPDPLTCSGFIWVNKPKGVRRDKPLPVAPGPFRLTSQGRMVWNLEALLRPRMGYRAYSYPCFDGSDPRTYWNAVHQTSILYTGCNSYVFQFDQPTRESAFSPGRIYLPNQRISDSEGEVPVLLRGRLIRCRAGGSDVFAARSIRYRFGGPYTWWLAGPLQPSCRRAIILPASHKLLLDPNGSGNASIYLARTADSLVWTFSCPRNARHRPLGFQMMVKNRWQSRPVFAQRSHDLSAEGNRTAGVGHLTVIIKAGMKRSACQWRVWAIPLSRGPEW